MPKFRVPADARAIANFSGGWVLWERSPTATSSFLWVRLKLMLPESTPRKNGFQRAYRLVWNPLAGRLARSGEAYALARAHPELYDQVIIELTTTYPKSWLIEVDGRDAAEIGAEIARLAQERQLRSAKAEARARNGDAS